MAKAKEQYVRPIKKENPKLPPYEKKYTDLHKNINIGDTVRVHIRIMDGTWELKEVEGIVETITGNALVLSGRAFGIPWYTIHNWEIVE